MTSGLNRRDADLLSVVRRLESSINTLDINARLCLRDALVSLSNKASNPAMPPTPQQEAMNRAAEYLVLRMLSLSGHQVMHTPPGTGAPYAETSVVTAAHQQMSGPVAAAAAGGGGGNGGHGAVLGGMGSSMLGSSSSVGLEQNMNRMSGMTRTNVESEMSHRHHHHHHQSNDTSTNNKNMSGMNKKSLTNATNMQKDDGTVAASTGTEKSSVAQPDEEMMDVVVPSSGGGGGRSKIGECGGIEVVFDIMRCHLLQVIRIQTQACLTIANLTYGNEANKEEVVRRLAIMKRADPGLLSNDPYDKVGLYDQEATTIETWRLESPS